MKLFRHRKVLISNLTEEEKKSLKHYLENAKPGFEFLASILEDKIQEIDNKADSIEIYDCPTMTHKRAYLDGAKHQLKYLHKLLTESEEK